MAWGKSTAWIFQVTRSLRLLNAMIYVFTWLFLGYGSSAPTRGRWRLFLVEAELPLAAALADQSALLVKKTVEG